MSATFRPEQFPVIDPAPSGGMILSSFRTMDFVRIPLFAGIAGTAGYMAGCRPAHRLRMQMVRYNLGLGLFTALTLGWLESRQRLTGLQENEREVVRYGCLTEQELKDWHKRADKQNVYLINSSSYEYEKRAQEKA